MSKFSPGKLMTAFFVFFFPILIFLGSWQIVRGLDKESIVSQHRLNQSMPVINEDQIKEFSQEELVYRTVSLEGAFGDQTYILDNRLYRQEAGHEIFTIFNTTKNSSYLVNRGWLSKTMVNDSEVGFENDNVTIQGVLSPFTRFGLSLSEQDSQEGWPKYVQQLDLKSVQKDLGIGIQNKVLQLSAASLGAFEPIWRPVDLQPSRHYGYAVQWFGLALVLFCSYLYYGYKKD